MCWAGLSWAEVGWVEGPKPEGVTPLVCDVLGSLALPAQRSCEPLPRCALVELGAVGLTSPAEEPLQLRNPFCSPPCYSDLTLCSFPPWEMKLPLSQTLLISLLNPQARQSPCALPAEAPGRSWGTQPLSSGMP